MADNRTKSLLTIWNCSHNFNFRNTARAINNEISTRVHTNFYTNYIILRFIIYYIYGWFLLHLWLIIPFMDGTAGQLGAVIKLVHNISGKVYLKQWIFSNDWRRLNRMWRIIQIEEDSYRPRWITSSMICIIRTKAEFNKSVLLVIQNISNFLETSLPSRRPSSKL